ncbi:3-isopropylmalate/(R)-2-methylmalate dehydratase small subunit [Duganella sp. 3397]|uniref:3-isopropylmalate dehydratase small subunit n=1 Tax=Duganella sp. 3397 TaxID=2817732 RepID=UPI002857D4E9|nr:3-isopropylmalate dehydratase small subunit [Duganella sp. 3397]MDR7048453.1 3-isopropylmalate/(R)-2-methylmalate dehydratase small subunit [Duganella sp. 3397]
MEPFLRHRGLVAPIDRANVDTDAILPKQYLKMTQRSGFGRYLFDDWRYLDPGHPGDDCSARRRNADFVLNQPRYDGASILLARANFGCGSSREHAPWAIREFGLRVIIAPSFADIFANNCTKNGVVPVTLPAEVVDALFRDVDGSHGFAVSVDLDQQTVTTPDGQIHTFEFDAFRKRCLLDGVSEIDLALRRADDIVAYERQRHLHEPWVFS